MSSVMILTSPRGPVCAGAVTVGDKIDCPVGGAVGGGSVGSGGNVC